MKFDKCKKRIFKRSKFDPIIDAVNKLFNILCHEKRKYVDIDEKGTPKIIICNNLSEINCKEKLEEFNIGSKDNTLINKFVKSDLKLKKIFEKCLEEASVINPNLDLVYNRFTSSLSYINLLFIVITYVFIYRFNLFSNPSNTDSKTNKSGSESDVSSRGSDESGLMSGESSRFSNAEFKKFFDFIKNNEDITEVKNYGNINPENAYENINSVGINSYNHQDNFFPKSFRAYFYNIDWTSSPEGFYLYRKVIVDFLIYFIYSFIINFDSERKSNKFRIIKEIEELGDIALNEGKHILLFQAVGSVTSSSDYDISIKSFKINGSNLEYTHHNHDIFIYFDTCFRSLFGKSSSDLFDTNLYTTDYSIFSKDNLPYSYFQLISNLGSNIKVYAVKNSEQSGGRKKKSKKRNKKKFVSRKKKKQKKHSIKKKKQKKYKSKKNKYNTYKLNKHGGSVRPRAMSPSWSLVTTIMKATNAFSKPKSQNTNIIKDLQLELVNMKFRNNAPGIEKGSLEEDICEHITEKSDDCNTFTKEKKDELYIEYSRKLIDTTKEIINKGDDTSEHESLIDEYIYYLNICSYLADEAYYSIDTQLHVIEIIQKGSEISLEPDQYKHSIIENLADLVSYHKKDIYKEDIYSFLRKVSKYLYRIFHGIQRLDDVDLTGLENLFPNFSLLDILLKQLEEIKNNKTDIKKSEGLINKLLNTSKSHFIPIHLAFQTNDISNNISSVSQTYETPSLISTIQFIKNLIQFIKNIFGEDLLITPKEIEDIDSSESHI